ncbi:MAG: hypothetical protein R3A44_40190 [Caldilineaceae bacterium]
MPIILSLSQLDVEQQLWAAGPEGLFAVNQSGQNGDMLQAVPQPQQELYCCGVADDRVLVGGLPHGVAFSLDAGGNWQASWMDGVEAPVVCIAPDPRVAETGVILAGSAGGGILRTRNRGASWWVSNFGLRDYSVLTLAWAPVAPDDVWPRREVVFAGTEEGIYRSPNAGLGWKRSEGFDGVCQVIAVSPHFHADGLVLIGTEEIGLWRSHDGGHTFARVESAPLRVDALTANATGWILSNEEQLWSSTDGLTWSPMDGTRPTLTLFNTGGGVWSGGEHGLELLK